MTAIMQKLSSRSYPVIKLKQGPVNSKFSNDEDFLGFKAKNGQSAKVLIMSTFWIKS